MQAVAYAPLDLATRVEGSTRRTPADVGVTTGRPVYQRQPEADAIALRRELVVVWTPPTLSPQAA